MRATLLSYDLAMPATIVLCPCYAMYGTDRESVFQVVPCIHYGMSGTDTESIVILCFRCAMLGTDIVLSHMPSLRDVRFLPNYTFARSGQGEEEAAATQDLALSLRPCYAKSGTGIASYAMSLRHCYAKSGTDLAYAATRRAGVLARKSVGRRGTLQEIEEFAAVSYTHLRAHETEADL
eukprot:3941197-Rhodomonas_salina.3